MATVTVTRRRIREITEISPSPHFKARERWYRVAVIAMVTRMSSFGTGRRVWAALSLLNFLFALVFALALDFGLFHIILLLLLLHLLVSF